MSLPPRFLDELRARASIVDIVGRKVTWDNKKSNAAKGDMWAPCPFHQEKTASFHVDEAKGFYYCFGCHAKGDAIGFIKETENLSFMEAVETLARETGLEMPQRDPESVRKLDRQSELIALCETAANFFALQLRGRAGGKARAYLASRGLDEDACTRWRIGFAPDAWQGLHEHLSAMGISDTMMLAAGLVKSSDRGQRPYDVFRNRIMFPITNQRNQTIAFGGRAMAPDAPAKYLNSPETELFHKGHTLYNIASARKSVGRDSPLIVAEGYMDVIALSEYGFSGAVAPLGTAITEAQLALIWRHASEPIIALDGDQAGLRAAMRLIDLTMPLLQAGRGLRFARMPQGRDPDDVLRAEGAAGMRKRLEAAVPLVELLWQRETEGQVFDSPERKAMLEKKLNVIVNKIADPSLRKLYFDDLRQRRYALARRNQPRRADWRRSKPVQVAASAAARSSTLASDEDNPSVIEKRREQVILAGLISNPEVIERVISRLEMMEWCHADHHKIAVTLIQFAKSPQFEDDIQAALGSERVETLMTAPHVKLTPVLRHRGQLDVVTQCIEGEMDRLAADRGWRAEIEDALDASQADDEHVAWRLQQAVKAHDRALRGTGEDRNSYETSENGLRLDKAERGALADLLKMIDTETKTTRKQ